MDTLVWKGAQILVGSVRPPLDDKECVAVGLYKKNVSVACVGIDFLLIRPLYTMI